ncbi:MAG TPA: serine/threonine-protein kinase [Polyangiales bacterium]
MSALRPAPADGDSPRGRYDVGEVLASGGMGTVHRAFDRLGQRWVAYKRMRALDAGKGPRMAALFQREYDTLTRLAHPNIVEAFDYGVDAQGPYYTMELLTGADLAQLAPLPIARACQLLRHVASALSLLHARRLVHRDLSPRNVRLTADGRAKLLDFGVLIPFGPTGYAVGAAPFIAPEALAGDEVDQRTDLYVLGALAYFLVTGHTHVQTRRMEQLPDAWRERLLPPSRRLDGVPPALDELVLSLLELSPSARPSGAAQVIERLSAIAQLPPDEEADRAAHSYLLHAPLVGRRQSLNTLQHALHDAISGHGQIVVLEGEQGLGRSALLDRLAIDAQVAGAHVLRTRATHRRTLFGAAQDLVRDGLTLLSVSGTPTADLRALANWSISTREEAQSATSMDAWERQAAAADSLAQVFMALSTTAPFVLLVDDAQDLDAESLSWLASLADPLRERAILLVLALQKGQACEDAQAWAKLAAHATHHELLPLDAVQVTELVTTLFGDAPKAATLAAWLHGQTGGNPGHSMDLARLLLAQGAIRYANGGFTLAYEFGRAAPDLHARALLARLAQVSPEARALAQLLALHDGPLNVITLVRAGRSELPKVVRALEELTRRGAVVKHGEDFACAGELLRAAIRGTLGADEARALHRALGRALMLLGDGSLEGTCNVAEHLLRAGEPEQLEAALMLTRWAEPHKFDLALQRRCVVMLESALSVLERHGYSERDCIPLLVPLCLGAYYVDFAAFQRYFDRTLAALREICGLVHAERLRNLVSPRVALSMGLLAGYTQSLVSPSKCARLPFAKYLEALIVTAGTATAAAAFAFDVKRARRVVEAIAPMAAAHPRTPLFLSHQLCSATADLVSGRLASAADKYKRLLRAYQRPVLGIDKRHAEQIRSGCLAGLAEALLSEDPAAALRVAEQLDTRSGAFYAPHVESVRATYFAYRADAPRAALHRRRAEVLSLRSGVSWTVVSVMAMRLTLPSALTGDIVALTSVVSDLDQLSSLSPGLSLLRDLARAHLCQLRGKLDEAIAGYEQVFANPDAELLPTYPAERALQMQALSARGDHARAHTLGSALIETLERDTDGKSNEHLYCIASLTLARVELSMGDPTRAARRLDATLIRGLPEDSIALHGSLHRERAYAAALLADEPTFELHYAHLAKILRDTHNPLLLQQCAALESEARRLGLHCSGRLAELNADALDFETVIERPTILRTTARN